MAVKELTKQQTDPHASLVRCRTRIQQALSVPLYEAQLKENPGLNDGEKERLKNDCFNQTRKQAAEKCNHLTDDQVELILTEDATDADVLGVFDSVVLPEVQAEEDAKPKGRSRRRQ